MRPLEQLTEVGQVHGIAAAIGYARRQYMDGERGLAAIVEAVMADISRAGLDVLLKEPRGNLAAFRRWEFAAAINRVRGLRVNGQGGR